MLRGAWLGVASCEFSHRGFTEFTPDYRTVSDAATYLRRLLRPRYVDVCALTVRAQHAQILQTVIRAIAIDVLQLKRDRRTLPLGQTTSIAPALQQSSGEQSRFQLCRRYTGQAVGDEKFVQRCLTSPMMASIFQMTFSTKVGSVDSEQSKFALQHGIISAGWL